MTRTWRTRLLRAALLATLGLLGCSGDDSGFVPLRPGGSTTPFQPLQFGERNFDPAPIDRPGADARDQATRAVATGVRSVNTIGVGLDAYNESSRALSLLDNFVFVPNRSRLEAAGRALTTELINEQDGEYTLTGYLRTDDQENTSLLELRIVGPVTDLLFQSLLTPNELLEQLEGRDVDEWGNPVLLRTLDDLTIGGTEQEPEYRGEELEEAYYGDTEELQYAAETAYELVGDGMSLHGQDIWFDRDGFWVSTEFILELLGEDVLGAIQMESSDGVVLSFLFTQDAFVGDVRDEDGELIGDLDLTDDGNLLLLDPETGEPILDDDGAPIVFELDFFDDEDSETGEVEERLRTRRAVAEPARRLAARAER